MAGMTDSITRSALLHAALAYAAEGLRVFPAEPGGKRPAWGARGDGWKHHASTEPLWVVEQWSARPDANVIVVCGQTSGVTVLDLDTKALPRGGGRYAGEQLAVHLLGEDWKARWRYTTTPSGGYHLWFPWQPTWGNRELKLDGVKAGSVQGEGSYVVVWPSRTGDGPYLETHQHLPRLNPVTPELDARVRQLLGAGRGGGGGVSVGRAPRSGAEPVPDWEAEDVTVPAGITERLPAKVWGAMVRGDWSGWGDDRSAGVAGVCAALWGQRLTGAQVLRVLMLCGETLQVGWDRRPDMAGAAEWLWRYCVLPTRPPSPAEVFGVATDAGVVDGVVDGDGGQVDVGARVVGTGGAGVVDDGAGHGGGDSAPSVAVDPGVASAGARGGAGGSLTEVITAAERAIRAVHWGGPDRLDEARRLLGLIAEQDALTPVDDEHLLDVLHVESGLGRQALRKTLLARRRAVAEERRAAAKAERRGPVAEYVYVEQTGAFWCLPEPMWVAPGAFSMMHGLVGGDELAQVISSMPRFRKATYKPVNPWAEGERGEGGGAAERHPNDPRVELNQGTVRHELNTYTAPSMHPQLGAGEEDVRPWLRLARLVLRIPEPELEHLVRWMAYTLQHPDRKINHMLLLGGDQGIGKDHLIAPLVRGCENNVLQIPGLREGSGFDHPGLARAHLLVLQELRLGGRWRDASEAYNAMKNKLASPPDTIPINLKNVRQYDIPNVVNVLAMTNHRDAIRLEQDDRRACMVWCEGRPGRVPGGDPVKYWRGFRRWLDQEGGAEAVVGWLLGLDVTGFEPGAAPPTTEWKRQAGEDALPPVAALVQEILDGEEMTHRELVGGKELRDLAQVAALGELDVTLRDIGWAMSLLRYRAKRMRGEGGVRGGSFERVYFLREEEHWDKAPAGALRAWLELERNGTFR